MNLARFDTVVALAIVPMLAVATAAAQDKPDVSGTWALADPASVGPDAARNLTLTMTVVRQNVRGEPIGPFFDSLTVTREFATGARSVDSYRLGVEGGTARGTVGGLSTAGAGSRASASQTRFSVRWQGNRLVIETASYSGASREAGPYTEHAEVWQLDAAGMLILTVTDRGSEFETRTSILTYRRN